MKTKLTSSLLLLAAFLLAFTGIRAQQPQQLIHFWDFNNSVPTKSPGGDSLGTFYAYGHTFTQDTAKKTGTLYADYTRIPSANPQMVYTRPHANQTLPLAVIPVTLRDSIMDNGNGGAAYYDYSGAQFNYFNVSDSSIGGNNYVRTRNPDENSYLYIYASTAGWNNIHLYYALSASSTKGAKFNIFSYSCDSGVTWKKLVYPMDTFNVGHHPYYDSMQAVNPITAVSGWYPVQINFSSDAQVNNNRKFVLRIQFEGTSSNATSGNDRYDNFAFTGDSNTANVVSYIVRRQNVGPCWGDSNGSARVYVAGGTAPYSYSWSNNATNSHGAGGLATDSAFGLKPGTYTVTVTDFNDNASTSVVTILQPTQVVPSVISKTNVSCNGGNNGTINTLTAGGTSPYTYLWNNGKTSNNITGLSAGTYTLTVTDHLGCSTTISVSITEPTIISIVPSNTPVTCASLGTATAAPSGGTPHLLSPNYAYSWSNGATTATATGLGAGSYTVTVTDSLGCSQTASTTVTSSGANVVLTPTDLTCNGSGNGSIVSNVTGGSAPYTYNWSNGATTTSINGLSAGIYTLTVTEHNGCIDNANTTITEPAVLKDTIVGISIPVETISYWDFNLTPPFGGAGGDSLGNNVNPLPASFTAIPANHPHLVFSHTPADGILDNLAGPPSAYVNDLPICGNDTVGQTINNLGVRTRNPTVNSAFYWYIPTTGYDNIKVDWALSASSTKGAQYLVFQYSTNGGVSWNRLTGAMDTFNTGNHTFHPDSLNAINPVTASSNWYPVHIDFSSVQAVNNNPNMILKITFAGNGIGGASGNNRFDNISVSGQQVPKVACHNGNNGDGQADVSGGTGPYSYSWSNGATTSTVNNLVPGIATVTVTDAHGCSVTASVNVINPPAIVDSLSLNDGCNNSNNGSILSIPIGGTGPYKWSWQGGSTNNMITGLTPSTYSVTVTDVNGCTVTANATLTNPAVLLANATSTGITCNGANDGTGNSSPTGGTSPYKYKWSAGAGGSTNASVNGLHPGTDTITVTDADGCTATASIVITQPSILRDSISSFIDELCNGGNTATATAGVTGGTGPYTYNWSNGNSTAIANNLTAGGYTVTIIDANGCAPVTANITITEPTALNPSMSSTLTTCLGNVGSATATVSGGTPNYSYAWSNGGTTSTINNLTVGTYSVTVNDANSCGVTASVNVVASGGPRDSIASQVNNLCFGGSSGSAFVGAQGGTPPYTYLWNNGDTHANATGLSSGSYTVTVTDGGGCTNNAIAVITNPSMLRDSITSITNNVCGNGNTGSATVGVNGGTSPYSYSWTNGAITQTAIALTAGTYTVTVTDNNGCNVTASATITQPPLIIDSISSHFNGCIGNSLGNATLGVTGGVPPYTYMWNPGGQTSATATGLTAGTYTVSVHDVNGCTWFLNTTITPDSVPTVTFKPGADSVVCDTMHNLSLVTFGHPAGGTFSGSFVAAGVFHPHTAGNGIYTITYNYTNAGGCSDSAKHTIKVDSCSSLGVNEVVQSANNIVIYPNPTVGQFNVSGLTAGSIIEIYDGIGKLIITSKADKENMILNLGDKADGIYLVRVINKDGVYATQQKVIKLH